LAEEYAKGICAADTSEAIYKVIDSSRCVFQVGNLTEFCLKMPAISRFGCGAFSERGIQKRSAEVCDRAR
jgi:hypothetical protein